MKVQVSANFRKYAKRTILSIFIFAFSYILLLLIAVGFTVGLTAIGGWILLQTTTFITIILFLGLCATGLSVLYFLVKFVFASTKIDTGHLLEINEKQEPALFALIQQVVSEVETNFPKKVYLSHDVNASVFYDSNFWSMFLPIRKNLQIGIGLVNTVNQQELKAILAHEFGHFSQRSMKVGSYVYHVNQIIYNMLYKNEDMDSTYEKMANVTGYATIFIGISVFIIRQIQQILKKLYNYININYMALSREMEFHADEIAANVAGSQALADALLRLKFANHALEEVLNFYNEKVSENLRSANIFVEQRFVMKFLATRNGYVLENELPKIEISSLKKYNKSKLNFDNQWASHPSDEDRINALQKLNIIKSDLNINPAFKLLSNDAIVAVQISDNLFSRVEFQESPKTLNTEHFNASFLERHSKYAFSPLFNDIFNVNNPVLSAGIPTGEQDQNLTFEDLFSSQNVERTYELNALENDKVIIEAINKGTVPLKTFDYDGIKLSKKDISSVIEQIEVEINEQKKQVESNNQKIYSYFFQIARQKGEEELFSKSYIEYAAFHKQFDELLHIADDLAEHTQFIFTTSAFEEIVKNLDKIKPFEVKIKKELKKIITLAELEINETNRISIEKYISAEHLYFNVDQYDNNKLELLFNNINLYRQLINELYFLKKNAYLKNMENLVGENETKK